MYSSMTHHLSTVDVFTGLCFNNEFEGSFISLYSDYVVKSSDKERYMSIGNIMFHG